MSLSSPVPEPPEVHTTELDWPDQARRDGWELIDGHWQRDGRAESYDDGDWVYLGDGVWEDAYIASLPADTRRDVLHRYTATVAEQSMPADGKMPAPSNNARIGTADTRTCLASGPARNAVNKRRWGHLVKR